jgi:hypothetical protein
LVILRAILDFAFDFEGVRRFLRFAGVRGLDPLAFFALLGLFAFLTAAAFRALAFALLSARTLAARASSSLKGSASVSATTLQGLAAFRTVAGDCS